MNSCIDDFEGGLSAQFNDIEAPDLGDIIEEVTILRADIYSLTKSNILSIPLVIP